MPALPFVVRVFLSYNMNKLSLLTCLIFTLVGCADNQKQDLRFTELSSSTSRIDFENNLVYSNEVNVYTFRNFYNGAGVGSGDFNNDGFIDLYFCGNQADNKLYLNKGNLTFEDITRESGTASPNVWSTGVSLADVNGDGWLDIYVCKSGPLEGPNRYNELFINQGVQRSDKGLEIVTFVESAEEYGLNDLGLSTHAAFFDYDLDGDLDCYLLNNSFKSVGNYDLVPGQRNIRDPEAGNKLLRNNLIERESDPSLSIFEDVSEEAGIYGSQIGFGLGVSVGDVNQDGWPDIFVSNDFFEKDYLYINLRNGTFKESSDDRILEQSMGSMGADIADINDDGLPEIFVTEMLPREERRIKTKALFENWNKYKSNVDQGYHRQFARNALHLNVGHGEFVEVGRLSGVEATDWSWGALMMDLDNDGLKDIFVANGIYKDLLDQDYINFYSNPAEVRRIIFDDEGGLDKLVDMIPTEPLPNVIFKNLGNLGFESVGDTWGFEKATFSNGSSYADLDNDGDLEIIVNNINMPALIYVNNADLLDDNHFLKIDLVDNSSFNVRSLGARITVYCDSKISYQEITTAKGFMSSVPSTVHFGLGDKQSIDSLFVTWPDHTTSRFYNLPVDTLLRFDKKETKSTKFLQKNEQEPLFEKIEGLDALQHIENDYSDFDKEPLLLEMHSNMGPCLCSGDVNNDGMEDLYLGGASGQAGQLFIQDRTGGFSSKLENEFVQHKESEDVDCLFFDANNDQRLDLYVASGSSEFGPNNANLRDRLYINDGGGIFTISPQLLPTFNFENTSAVRNIDFDQDGDQDLVVGIFLQPLVYGIASNVYLLENNGAGQFTNVSSNKAKGFKDLGMITGLDAYDYDGDQDDDVIVVGEWMSVRIFENNSGVFKEDSIHTLNELKGLWKEIEIADLDGDGRDDLLLGNHGLNSRLKASKKHPLHMYVNDFDGNGRPEQIVSYSTEEGEFPISQRNDLLKQLPALAKRYPNFKSYAGQTVQDIFGDALNSGFKWSVNELRSAVVWNNGDKNFEVQYLPLDAQKSQIFSLLALDVDGDGIKDVVLGGNQYRSKPEMGIYAGSFGTLLRGMNRRLFEVVDRNKAGLFIRGEIRAIKPFTSRNKESIVFALNNDKVQIYEID